MAETELSGEHRCFGPPGTGKTTWLSRQIELAAEKHGPDNIIVASFSKTAATELNRRKLPIPSENQGTLHALCYRAMGKPDLVANHISEWNEEFPQFSLSLEGSNAMDEMGVDSHYASDGDRCLNEWNIHRAMMKPTSHDAIPVRILDFVKKYENWKTSKNLIDFSDMIQFTAEYNKPPPGHPEIGMYDEVQDFSPLELSLVRQWAKHQRYIILVGDDDQAIFSFKGADPKAFLYPDLPPERKRVLRKSWRLPHAIYALAKGWISTIKNREPKEFEPKNTEGKVVELPKATIKAPEQAIEIAGRNAQDGKTTMILTSCGYMLGNVKAQLRANGLPYHNPYRLSRGDWNPMGSFANNSKKISTRERLLAFLDTTHNMYGESLWSLETLDLWVSMIKTRGVFKKGGKEKLNQIMDPDSFVTAVPDQVLYEQIFDPQALKFALRRDLAWFREVLVAAKKKAIEYPLRVYERHGRNEQVLREKPRIIIGTIHSTKGGEADEVILFPDISIAAMEGCSDSTSREAVIRTFYVGMTRAKESLYLCAPISDCSVRFPNG